MNRRLFLFSLAFPVLLSSSRYAISQGGAVRRVEIAELQEIAGNRILISNVFTDVNYLRSWRFERKPKGYEDEKWVVASSQLAASVRSGIEGNPRIVESSVENINKYGEIAYQRFGENESSFLSFIDSIGISPDGIAGQRMLRSQEIYMLFSISSGLPNFETGSASSFFWPFC